MDKILEPFLKNIRKEFHVRELARIMKKSPTNISKYLKKYEKKGIIKSERKLNHLFFRANTQNIEFKHLKLFYNVKIIYDSGLIDFLIKEFNHPEAIILFGSFARAEDIESSDIDICMISPNKEDSELDKFEKKLKHKIQLFVLSRKDIERMKEKNKELLNNILNGINLEGYLEVFR